MRFRELQNGNEKRQREAETRDGNRSGKKKKEENLMTSGFSPRSGPCPTSSEKGWVYRLQNDREHLLSAPFLKSEEGCLDFPFSSRRSFKKDQRPSSTPH